METDKLLSDSSESLLHVRNGEEGKLSLFASHKEIRHRFGPGLQLYLQQSLLGMGCLVLLSVWCTVQWGVYVSGIPRDVVFDYQDFFVSEYPSSLSNVYFWTSSVTVVLAFCIPVVALMFKKRFIGGSRRTDWSREENAIVLQPSAMTPWKRRFISLLLSLCLLGLGITAMCDSISYFLFL
jgi:hypothetical protein